MLTQQISPSWIVKEAASCFLRFFHMEPPSAKPILAANDPTHTARVDGIPKPHNNQRIVEYQRRVVQPCAAQLAQAMPATFRAMTACDTKAANVIASVKSEQYGLAMDLEESGDTLSLVVGYIP